MRLWRIVQAFPWRTALLAASALALTALPSWAWYSWELPPLQRYYLRAYWDSSNTRNESRAVVEVQWLELTAPGRKNRWSFNYDVTDDPHGDFPVVLSSEAVSQGWTGIKESPPEPISSAELKNILRSDFYGGRTFREVVSEPVSYGCFALLIVLLFAWKMRDDIGFEWTEVWRALWAPESVWDSGWDVSPYKPSILASIRKRIAPGLAAINRTRERLRLLVVKCHRSASHSRVDLPAASGHTRPPLSADDRERSTVSSTSNPGSLPQANTESNGHRVFPGSSPSNVPSKHVNAWHESDWIE